MNGVVTKSNFLKICAGISLVAATSIPSAAHASDLMASATIPAQAQESMYSAHTPQTNKPAKFNKGQLRKNLNAQERAKWDKLPEESKNKAVEILNDPRIDSIETDAQAKSISPDLAITERTGTGVAIPTTSSLDDTPQMSIMAVARNAWYERNWTIFGVAYTKVRTDFDFYISGGRVTSARSCYGTYVNYVPLRSIDKNSWSTLGNGLGTCETRWTLGRPLQSTVTGIQGLRVNGYGTIISTWGP